VSKRVRRTRLASIPNRFLPEAAQVGDVWAMDFVFDRFADSSKFRCFTMIDILSREVPGIFVSRSMSGFSPVSFLEELESRVKLPKHFILDNGTEFKNHVFLSWCEANKISVHFIDAGKPVQNAYIESFNGKFRAEFLNQKQFRGINQIRIAVKKWVQHYNEDRPHSSLDYLTPKEFAAQEKNVLDPKINLLVLKTG
jgi:putative transposase